MSDVDILNARYEAARSAVAARGVNPTYLLTTYFAGHTGLLEHECAKCPVESQELIDTVEAMFAIAEQDGVQMTLKLEEA